MGVLVEDGVVVAVEQAGDRADVRDVAGGEHERRFPPVERRPARASSSRWRSSVPLSRREPVTPVPYLLVARCAASITSRVVREAQVVVRAEVDVLVALDREPGPRGALDRLVVRPVAGRLGQSVVGEAREGLEPIVGRSSSGASRPLARPRCRSHAPHPHGPRGSQRPASDRSAARDARPNVRVYGAPRPSRGTLGIGQAGSGTGSGRPAATGSSRICLHALEGVAGHQAVLERSSKVQRSAIVRRRSGPLVGEPGSVVGRPMHAEDPDACRTRRGGGSTASMPEARRGWRRSAERRAGRSSMNDRGNSPNASAKRPTAITSRPAEPGQLHDEADLLVGGGEAGAEAVLVELAVPCRRPCRRTTRRGRSGA